MKKEKAYVELRNGITQAGNLPTFWDVLTEGYGDICKEHRWNATSTKSEYNGYYNQLYEFLGEKAMQDIDQEMVEQAIISIQNGRKRRYADVTVYTMFRLIRVVVKYAVAKEIITEDFLWGADLGIDGEEQDENWATEHVVLQKSLLPQEEIAVKEMLLTDPYQSGKRMGLSLMFTLGLRNGEACGIQYADIKEMRKFPGYHVLYVAIRTVTTQGELKAGGKTSNAFRKLPLPDAVYRFLMKRKRWLEEQVALGKLVLPPGMSGVDEFFVASKDNDPSQFCTPTDLGKAGKQLFKDVNMDERKLAYIERAMRDKQLLEEMGLQEKDATPYLFRRNLATHLRILGMTQSEIEYFMGHEILDGEVGRNDFVNEDQLIQICRKLNRRPLINEKFDRYKCEVVAEEGRVFNYHSVEKCLGVHAQIKAGESLILYIEADEPGQRLYAEMPQSDVQEVTCESFAQKRKNVKEVNVIADYHAVYRKALNMLHP